MQREVSHPVLLFVYIINNFYLLTLFLVPFQRFLRFSA